MGSELVFSSNCPIQGQAKFTRRLCLILLAVLLFWVRTIWCSRLHQLQPLVCTILWRARYNHLWDKKGIDWSSTIMTVIWTCSLFGFIWMDSALLLPHLLNNIDVNTHNAARPILDFLVTFSGVVHWVWPITRSKATPITVNLLQSTVILSAINVTQTFRFKVSVAVLQLWYIYSVRLNYCAYHICSQWQKPPISSRGYWFSSEFLQAPILKTQL